MAVDMSAFTTDLRYAARGLSKSPGFAAVAVLTLALGIGGATAIFSVVDAVLLRPAPFEGMERLMMVWETDRKAGTTREPASLPDYLDFAERSGSFESLAAIHATAMTVTDLTADPLRSPVASVSAGFLPLVGIRPVLGRVFTEDEARPGGDAVVLVAEEVWDRLYARSPDVLSREVRLDGRNHRIVGVVPADADFGVLQLLNAAAYGRGFADRGGREEVAFWTPLQKSIEEWPRSAHTVFVLGRLAEGAGRGGAQEEFDAIAAELEAAYPENDARGVNVEPLADVVFGDARPALLVLLAATALVMLVAAANVANLLLARAAARTREVAVRASLGAGTARLARQFLVEGSLLALLGAAAGVLLASIGLEVLLKLAPPDIPRLDQVAVDGRVLAATLALALVVGLAFSLVPLAQARRVDVQAALRADAGVAGTRGAGRGMLQSGLIVAELALAVVLVVGAGLLSKSFWQIQNVDPGFDAQRLMKAELQLPPDRYPVSFSTWPRFVEMHRFNDELLAQASALPGVEAAAIAVSHPMDRGYTNSFVVPGREAESADMPEISTRSVSPGYFETVGLPLIAGRRFDGRDGTDAAPVAILNQAAARLAFPDRDPAGQRIAFWGIERQIVGVVANEKFHGVTAADPIAVYTPIAQTPSFTGAEALLVRTGAGAGSLSATLQAVIHEVDPQMAVFGIEPLSAAVGRSVGKQQFTMTLLVAFAAVAMMLAVIGIHGVLSYLVSRRTSEVGVRMALGATSANVLGLIAKQTARLVGIGLVIGLLAAWFSTRLLGSLLYGVAATDPVTFVSVAVGAFAVAMLTALVPARRAAGIAPVEALRHD